MNPEGDFMEIHNHGNNIKAHLPRQVAPNDGKAVSQQNKVARSQAAEPQKLLSQVKSGETVRQQIIVEIKAKLQAGEYATRVAAEQAAEQIVGY